MKKMMILAAATILFGTNASAGEWATIFDGKDTRTHFTKGRLGFQVHGVGNQTEPFSVRWKNIKIREVE